MIAKFNALKHFFRFFLVSDWSRFFKSLLFCGCSCFLSVMVALFGSIYVSNIQKTASYFPDTMAYFYKLTEKQEEEIKKIPTFDSLYQTQNLYFERMEEETVSIQPMVNFSLPEDIQMYQRKKFLTDDFHGIIVSCGDLSRIKGLLGTTVTLFDSNNEAVEIPIVNLAYPDNGFQFFSFFSYQLDDAITYYIHEDYLSHLNYRPSGLSLHTIVRFKEKIDEQTDSLIQQIVGIDYQTLQSPDYLSQYRLIDSNIRSTGTIIAFMDWFSLLFLLFSLGFNVLVLMIFIADKLKDLRIRRLFQMSKQQSFQYLFWGMMGLFFGYWLVAFVLVMTTSYLGGLFLNYRVNLVFYEKIGWIGLVFLFVSGIFSLIVAFFENRKISLSL